jgi:hypothetical protein
MIFVYRKQSSTGARALSRALNGRRVFGLDQFRPGPDDTVVSWGSVYQPRNGEAVLNVCCMVRRSRRSSPTRRP